MDLPWVSYNYPEPLVVGCKNYSFKPDDLYLTDLTEMAYHGWHYCQKVLVEIDLIYPYSDWVPDIDEDTKRAFKESVDIDNPLPVTLYEKDGKLIMSDDYEVYYLYREYELVSVSAVIVGHFTKRIGLEILERPFKVKKPKSVFRVL